MPIPIAKFYENNKAGALEEAIITILTENREYVLTLSDIAQKLGIGVVSESSAEPHAFNTSNIMDLLLNVMELYTTMRELWEDDRVIRKWYCSDYYYVINDEMLPPE